MFLIWLRYWSCFRHGDKSDYCFLYIQFYKLISLWFYVDFFLNLAFNYNVVEYRHKYLNRQHISIKNPSLIVQGAPKRPDTFENLIEIKRVDENN